MSWIRVSQAKPCPICQKPDWCSIGDDGNTVCCMRVESSRESPCGGWIHKLNPGMVTRIRKFFKRTPPKPKFPPQYWHTLTERYRQNRPRVREAWSKLGLQDYSADELLVGFDWQSQGLTFPMWNGNPAMIGMRVKTHNGQFCVKGSSSGLFCPLCMSPLDRGLLLVAEGPTDTAACFELGYNVIGRPNCCAGANHIQTYLKLGLRYRPSRPVVIVADADKPGIDGARRLAERIKKQCLSVKVIVPLAKDMRAWYNQGATREDVMRLINADQNQMCSVQETAGKPCPSQ